MKPSLSDVRSIKVEITADAYVTTFVLGDGREIRFGMKENSGEVADLFGEELVENDDVFDMVEDLHFAANDLADYLRIVSLGGR